jgi:cyclic pyranopterin phosphate synthase
MDEFSHLDKRGQARMVDVGSKNVTEREAVAEATVLLSPPVRDALFGGGLPKGDALAVARVAGIQAAKRTADLIPLCHPLPLSAVSIDLDETEVGVRVVSTVRTTDRTGVEMEALTAASVAALTIYDMVKGVERAAEITDVRLLRKIGGKSGEWQR